MTSSNSNKDDSSSSSSADGNNKINKNNKRIKALEAKAVAEATATADAQYVPSVSLMNSNDPNVILGQVDGLSDLSDYEEKESIYVGRSVPITAGGSLEIPIQVSTPGSVVEYAVENKQYDFGFSITAERDESVTLVKVRIMNVERERIVIFRSSYLKIEREIVCMCMCVLFFLSFSLLLMNDEYCVSSVRCVESPYSKTIV
jgi:hypothetical protein